LAALLAESARFALSGSRARCDIDTAEGIWKVDADEGQISQVIHNLVVNADQSMPEGGTISIRAENVFLDSGMNVPLHRGRYVKIVIADEGVGISGEHMQKIFDPYFTTKQKGSGLGLSVSYSIVKRHDGYIMAESRQGSGTAFTVYLPASAGPGASDRPAGPPAFRGEGRILIVDDDEMVRNSMAGLLSAMGFEVENAVEGGEAVGKYRKAMESSRTFDLVILDLTMRGGMGGKDAVKELLRIDPHARAVVASGYSDDPVIARYRDYGFVDALAKPYTDKELSRILSMVVKGPGTGA
ncbi:MAG: response regulator, partial [Nitrospiraceae bacterium]